MDRWFAFDLHWLYAVRDLRSGKGRACSFGAIVRRPYGRIAAVLNGTSVEVVVRGGDGGLHRKRVTAPYVFSPSGGAWQAVGAGYTGISSLVARSGGVVEAFAQFASNQELRRTTLPSSTASGPPAWSSMGGGLIGSPTAVSGTDGRIDVFVRGTTSNIFHRRRDSTAGSFSAFSPMGGAVSW